jgi:O-antigen/teichoic acid export membrane protein
MTAGPVRSRVVASTLRVWLARTLSPLVRMGLVVVISRALGAEGLGDYQVVISYLAIFEIVPALGMWPLLVRNVAREPEQAFRYLLHAGALSLGASALLVVPMNVAGLGYGPTIREAMMLLSLALAPSVLLVVSEAVLIPRGRPEAVATLQVAESVALVATAAVLLWGGGGVVAVAAAMLACRTLAAAVAVFLALRVCPDRQWTFDWGFARRLLGETPVFFLSSVTWVLYSRLDVVVLSRLVPVDQVGYYGAAQRVLTMCQEVVQSMMVVTLPLLAASAARHADFQQVMARATKYVLMVGLPAAVGAMLVGGDLLTLIFGAKFAPSGPILTVLMWSFVPFGLMKLLGAGLTASDRQGADLAINLVVLAVTLALLVSAIPILGAVGAAVAVLGSVVTAVVLRAAYFWRRVTRLEVERGTGAVVASAGVLALVLMAGRGLPLGLLVPLGAAAYGVALLVLGAVDRTEIGAVPLVRGVLRSPRLAAFFGEETT